MDAPKPKHKRVQLSVQTKKAICDLRKENPTLKQENFLGLVNSKLDITIARPTLINILKDSAKWEQLDTQNVTSKKLRGAKYPQLEKALFLWFQQAVANRAELSDAAMLGKAKSLAGKLPGLGELDLTPGWLQRFKQRHGISSYAHHGESRDTDEARVQQALSELSGILLQKYSPEDVFNFDETRLYYRATPTRTLALNQPRGRKKQKDRVTLGLCVNVTGTEKLKLVFIGKSAKPRCFGKTWEPTAFVVYESNNTAWMTSTIFTKWLKQVNNEFAEKKRKVIILMDNAARHAITGIGCTKGTLGSFKTLELSNIIVLFLPPNTTSVVQPLAGGIIAAFKMGYKKRLVSWLLEQMDAEMEAAQGVASVDLGKLLCNIKQAIIWSCEVWEGMDSQTIRNCWRKVNILPQPWNTDLANADERLCGRSDAASAAELEQLIASLQLGDLAMPVEEYLECEPNQTEAQWTDEELLEAVMGAPIEPLNSEDTDEEESDCEGVLEANEVQPIPVSLQEARLCAAKLLQFVQDEPLYPAEMQLWISKIQGQITKTTVANLSRVRQTTIQQ